MHIFTSVGTMRDQGIMIVVVLVSHIVECLGMSFYTTSFPMQEAPLCSPLSDQMSATADPHNMWIHPSDENGTFINYKNKVFMEIFTDGFNQSDIYSAGTTVNVGCFFARKLCQLHAQI